MPPKKPTFTARPAPPPPAPSDELDAWIAQGRPETSRDVTGRHETPQDASRRPETSQDAPRHPRAPQGSKVLVERRSGDIKRRVTVYFEPRTAQRLEEYCDAERYAMSDVVTLAVREYLAKHARR